jgi:hypothetical protein
MADTDRFAIGLLYDMTVELTELIPKDESGKAMVNDKVYLESLDLSYIDSGSMDLVVTNKRLDTREVRTVRSDFGTQLGTIPNGTILPINRVYTETGRRQIYTRGRPEEVSISLETSSPLGVRVSAISQTGTVIP